MPAPARLAELIAGDLYDDRLDLSARGMSADTVWSRMPEVGGVKQLRAAGTSDRSVRLFLTFVSALERARDFMRLHRAGIKLFASHPEIFDPDPDSLHARSHRFGSALGQPRQQIARPGYRRVAQNCRQLSLQKRSGMPGG